MNLGENISCVIHLKVDDVTKIFKGINKLDATSLNICTRRGNSRHFIWVKVHTFCFCYINNNIAILTVAIAHIN